MGNGRVFQRFAQKARAKASRIGYIPWLNKISSNWVNLHGAARHKTSAKKKLYDVQKQLFYLLELNFERILHNTEYALRCLKAVWIFRFSMSRIFGSLRLLTRNYELQL